MTFDAVMMRFVYGQRHAGVVLIAAEASGFTKIEERAVSERWILKRFSSSSEPSVVITRVSARAAILRFIFLLHDASRATCHVRGPYGH